MTYKQAYDKIIEAYFKDQIKPWERKFCFCGNLNDNMCDWGARYDKNLYYSYGEYSEMEEALLSAVGSCGPKETAYEDLLFSGMSAALDVLKQIHIDRGEIIDEIPEFTKRNICATKN